MWPVKCCSSVHSRSSTGKAITPSYRTCRPSVRSAHAQSRPESAADAQPADDDARAAPASTPKRDATQPPPADDPAPPATPRSQPLPDRRLPRQRHQRRIRRNQLLMPPIRHQSRHPPRARPRSSNRRHRRRKLSRRQNHPLRRRRTHQPTQPVIALHRPPRAINRLELLNRQPKIHLPQPRHPPKGTTPHTRYQVPPTPPRTPDSHPHDPQPHPHKPEAHFTLRTRDAGKGCRGSASLRFGGGVGTTAASIPPLQNARGRRRGQ